jgi:hypothetical protein
VKLWQTIVLAGVLVVGVAYVVTHRGQLGLTRQSVTGQPEIGYADARVDAETVAPD